MGGRRPVVKAQLCGVAVEVSTIPEGPSPSPDWAPSPPRLVWPVTTPVAASTTYRMPLASPATQVTRRPNGADQVLEHVEAPTRRMSDGYRSTLIRTSSLQGSDGSGW